MDIGKFSLRLKSFNQDRCEVVGWNNEVKKDLRLRLHNFREANEQIVGVENVIGNLEKEDRLKAWKIALSICLRNGLAPWLE